MRKFILFMMFVSVPAWAQSFEWYAGLSHSQQKPNSGNFIVSEGGDSFEFDPCSAGGTRAVDTFGEGADAHTDTNTFKDRTYIVVAGPEWTFDRGNWKPFVHVMGRFARQTQAGGGIDVALTPRLALRVIEVDYNPIFAKDRHVPGNADFDQRGKGKTTDNITFTAGIVWH